MASTWTVAFSQRIDSGTRDCGQRDFDRPSEGRGQSRFAEVGVGTGNAEDSVKHPPVLENQRALCCVHNDISPVQSYGHGTRYDLPFSIRIPRWVGCGYDCAVEVSVNAGQLFTGTDKFKPSLKLSVAALE